MGEAPDTFSFGDLEAGFKAADLILDETILSQGTGHQPLETRTAMAYWQNGKLYLHGSTQSVAQTVPNIARMVGLKPEEVVLISEYTGGGFGSKIPGAHSMAIPALMAKKTGTPVMMRITREEEHYIGRARAGIQGRARIGFRKDGKILAMDFFTLQDNGPYNPQGDYRSAGSMATLNFQPEAYRWRGITVLTNTPPRTSQRSPGGMQMNAILDPIMAQAAKKLGHRPRRAAQDQRPGRQGALRAARTRRPTSRPTSPGQRPRGARQGRRDLRLGGQEGGQRPEARHEGARHRRGRRPLHRRVDRLRRPGRSSGPTARCRCRPASATSAPSRCSTASASTPRCSTRRGSSSRSSGATPRRACRGPASRPAARRCTR